MLRVPLFQLAAQTLLSIPRLISPVRTKAKPLFSWSFPQLDLSSGVSHKRKNLQTSNEHSGLSGHARIKAATEAVFFILGALPSLEYACSKFIRVKSLN